MILNRDFWTVRKMSRIFTTFLIGVLVLVVSLCAFAVASLGGGLADFLSQIPSFRVFVEINENIMNYETGNPVVEFELDKSILIISVLVAFMCIVKNSVNWFMKAFIPRKAYERFLLALNKFIWNFVVSIVCVPILADVTKHLLIQIRNKTNDPVSKIIALATAIILVVITMVGSSMVNPYRARVIILRTLVVPAIQIMIISAILSFVFCAFKSNRYILFGILSLIAISGYLILEWFRNNLIARKIINKRH